MSYSVLFGFLGAAEGRHGNLECRCIVGRFGIKVLLWLYAQPSMRRRFTYVILCSPSLIEGCTVLSCSYGMVVTRIIETRATSYGFAKSQARKKPCAVLGISRARQRVVVLLCPMDLYIWVRRVANLSELVVAVNRYSRFFVTLWRHL